MKQLRHMIFGSGIHSMRCDANNGINILDQSPICDDLTWKITKVYAFMLKELSIVVDIVLLMSQREGVRLRMVDGGD